MPNQQLILIIDDDPLSRELTTRLLSKDGFAVLCAHSGEEGLQLAHEQRPAAIFLDVKMPGMDGWEVLKALKADPELASIPVTMVTMMDERKKAYSMGADEYFVKPMQRSQLVTFTKKLLEAPLESEEPEAPKTVLIVEDDPANRSIMARILRNQGCDVVEAENGDSALKIVAKRIPDMIVLDLMMPVMDGFTFVQTLRSKPETSSIPVIVLTAKDLDERERRLLLQSVKKILPKGELNRAQLLQKLFQ